ncbi:hypothetical protein H8356DRAFT_1419446 [Neocallimastix lanati (nom. inval.)]|nr:hypothetical protein H8356DRAFT_1419446 [Neocallimastix sp. JGI-2020a]
MFRSYDLWVMSPPRFHCATLLLLGFFWMSFFLCIEFAHHAPTALRCFSDKNTKVFGYRPGNNSSTFNVSTHEGAGTFQALANKELTSPKANWASGL